MSDISEKISELRGQYNESFTCTKGISLGTYVDGYKDVPLAKDEEVEVGGYNIFAVDTESWAPKIRVNPRCRYLNPADHGCSSNSLECTNKKSIAQNEYTCYTCPHAKVFDV
jgi:hypothetical protein